MLNILNHYVDGQKYKYYASACAFSVTILLTMFTVLIAVVL